MSTTGDQFSETVTYNRNDTSIAQSKPDLVSQVKRTWQENKRPDAQAFLAKHPSVKKDRELVMDIAYEEYCLKRESGETIQASDFCERFPSIARSLYRQIEVDEFVRDHSDMFNASVQPQWPGIGDKLFDFTVVEELGRGAFARAYLCSQAGVGDRQVVVKVAFKGSFEAETLGRLSHPNIMPVFSVVEDLESGTSGMCMPFFGRGTLCDVLDIAFQDSTRPRSARVVLEAAVTSRKPSDRHQQAVPPIEISPKFSYVEGICAIGLQLAEALAHGHENKIFHGDLKPSNIVLSINGSPLIVGFNLSHDSESQVQMVGGTLPYMPPEQIRTVILGENTDPVGAECDIFSLGAILYELVTGKLPFGRPDKQSEQRALARNMLQLQKASAQQANKVNPNVSPRFSKLISKCLCDDPRDRPVSMQAVADELQRIWQGLRKARSRRRFLFVASAIGIPTSAVLVAGSLKPPNMKHAIELACLKKWDEAADELTQLIDSKHLAPDEELRAVFLRGQVRTIIFGETHEEEMSRSALDDLNRVVRVYGAIGCWEWRGFCHLIKGEHQSALSEYAQIKDRHPALLNNIGYAHVLHAKSEMRQPRSRKRKRNAKPTYSVTLNKAATSFRKSMELGPGLFEPHCNFARLYFQSKYIEIGADELLDAAETAVSLDPSQLDSLEVAAHRWCEKWATDQDRQSLVKVADYLSMIVQTGVDISSWFSQRPPFSKLPKDDALIEAVRTQSVPKQAQAKVRFVITPELITDVD